MNRLKQFCELFLLSQSFFCGLRFFIFILCILVPYFHWECCIQGTLNWHLTVSSWLAAQNLLGQAYSSGLQGPQRFGLGLFGVPPVPQYSRNSHVRVINEYADTVSVSTIHMNSELGGLTNPEPGDLL